MNSGNIKQSAISCLWLILATTLVPQVFSRAQNPSPHQGNISAKPTISITGVPHAGQGGTGRVEPISGVVKGVVFASHKVVIYAFAGETWWVQPTAVNPLTDVDNVGKWETDTHLGNSYAALLVRDAFKPPATIDALPSVQGDVIAIVRVAGVR